MSKNNMDYMDQLNTPEMIAFDKSKIRKPMTKEQVKEAKKKAKEDAKRAKELGIRPEELQDANGPKMISAKELKQQEAMERKKAEEEARAIMKEARILAKEKNIPMGEAVDMVKHSKVDPTKSGVRKSPNHPLNPITKAENAAAGTGSYSKEQQLAQRKAELAKERENKYGKKKNKNKQEHTVVIHSSYPGKLDQGKEEQLAKDKAKRAAKDKASDLHTTGNGIGKNGTESSEHSGPRVKNTNYSNYKKNTKKKKSGDAKADAGGIGSKKIDSGMDQQKLDSGRESDRIASVPTAGYNLPQTSEDVEAAADRVDAKARPKHLKIIYAACILIAIAMLYIVADTVLRYHTMQTYDDAEEEYAEEEVAEPVEETVEEPVVEPKVKPTWATALDVDFTTLQSQNADIIGWLYFENEDISYPLMYSTDNDFYLHHTYLKESAYAGSIFLDYHNSPDMTDSHSIIYGHNMKNLTMFGRLRYYRNTEGYYSTHQYFQIIMPDKKLRYHIFAYTDVSTDSSVYTIFKQGSDKFYELVTLMKQQSNQDTGVEVLQTDKVLTLSTCSTEEHRLIVNAVLEDQWDTADDANCIPETTEEVSTVSGGNTATEGVNSSSSTTD